jgi:hypothetical protein
MTKERTMDEEMTELRRIGRDFAASPEPLIEVEVQTMPDGTYLPGDPPPEGPPLSPITGGPFLA